MITFLLLAVWPWLQDPAPAPWLTPGAEVRAELVAEPDQYRFRLDAAGPVHLDLRSHFFDARLELRDDEDRMIAAADGGLFGRHARLTVDRARAGVEYRVRVVAQDAGAGPFVLLYALGAPPRLEAAALRQLELDDAKARVDAVSTRLGARSAAMADATLSHGWQLYLAGQLDAAERQFELVVDLRKDLFGADHASTLEGTDYLGFAWAIQGRHTEAAELFRRSHEARHRHLGADNLDTASSLFNLAQQLNHLGRYAEARPMYEEALRVRTLRQSKEHAKTRAARAGLANCLSSLADYQAALEMYRESLAQAEADSTAGGVEVAARLQDVGGVLVRLGRQREAIPLLQRARELCARELGERDPGFALSLIGYAQAIEADGRYREALPIFERALSIHDDAATRSSLGGLNALESLGNCLFRLGRYEPAVVCLEEAITISTALRGPQHFGTATLAHDLALVRKNQGRWDEARELYDRSIAAKAASIGRDHPETAVSLHALARLLLEEGLHEEARALIVEARDIRERSLGNEHFLTALSIQDLALLDRDEGHLDQALAGLEQALAIRRKTFGESHRDIGVSLHYLAEVLEARGELEPARARYEEALAVRRQVLGAEHPHVAESLHGLGRLLWQSGDFDAAREQIEEALALREKSLLPEHPDRVRNLNDLALLHADRDDSAAAWTRARQANDALEEHLQRVLWAQTESERFRFLASRHQALAILVALAERSADADAERIAYQAVLDWKGSASRAMLRGKERFETGLDERQRELLEELRATQSELSALVFRDDLAERDQRVAVLRQQHGRLELELNRSLGRQDAARAADLEALRAALPAGSAAVDFLVLPSYRPATAGAQPGSFGKPRLLAWSLHADHPGVHRNDLGDADEIERLVRAFLEDLVSRRGLTATEANASSNDALRERLWKPLAGSIGDAELVFVSPDSCLGGLPFETLQGDDGAFLIEDFAFAYQEDLLSLSAPRRPPAAASSLLVVGSVDYGRRAPGTVVSAARKYWAGLSATGAEADAVMQMHRDAFGEAAIVLQLSSDEASEARLKAEMPRFGVLHLATHGYFEPEGLASMFERVVEEGRRGQRLRAPDRQLVKSHPGLLSGLICAGANLPVAASGDDAYLTAEEVSWLELNGVDTVVLSACETGLGRPQAGEGMLGLRRSFRMAGARTIISSLWSVRDAATSELMQAYYRNLWLEGKGKLAALRAARLELLEANRRSKAGNGLPSTWGAFVLSGDWR